MLKLIPVRHAAVKDIHVAVLKKKIFVVFLLLLQAICHQSQYLTYHLREFHQLYSSDAVGVKDEWLDLEVKRSDFKAMTRPNMVKINDMS